MLFVGTSIIHPSTEGVFLLCNILDLLIYSIKLIDLDCANCAAKIENAVKKLDGVTDVTVSFMGQKMILETPDELFDSVLKEAKALIKKIEPDVTIKD